MAQFSYRANLSAKSFPFVSDNWGRSIIVPQYDQTFNRSVDSEEDLDKDAGIPQIYYCHNVMPFAQGFQSVGFTPVLDACPVAVVFRSVIQLQLDQDTVVIGHTTGNELYYNRGAGWNFLASAPYPGNSNFSTAYINGTNYIHFVNDIYTYNQAANTLVSAGVTGITPSAIFGITAAAGYMIAWDAHTVYHSSTISPVDFVPSLATGAGSDSIQAAKADITICVPHLQGFAIYTSKNCVFAIYSGNARYPFNFREIVASGGVRDYTQVSFDANTGNHYAYTTSGYQLISSTQAQTVFPELTDFLGGKTYEDFDEVTNTLSITKLTWSLQKSIKVISDRYIVFSYGPAAFFPETPQPAYTYAIIYDLVMKRYGKVKVNHVAVYERDLFVNDSFYSIELPKESIAFLQADGTVKALSFTAYDPTSSGVLIFGKYQFIRSNLLTVDTFTVENVLDIPNFSALLWVSFQGKENTPVVPTIISSGNRTIQYGTRATGINVSLVLKGNFQINTVTLQFHVDGRR